MLIHLKGAEMKHIWRVRSCRPVCTDMHNPSHTHNGPSRVFVDLAAACRDLFWTMSRCQSISTCTCFILTRLSQQPPHLSPPLNGRAAVVSFKDTFPGLVLWVSHRPLVMPASTDQDLGVVLQTLHHKQEGYIFISLTFSTLKMSILNKWQGSVHAKIERIDGTSVSPDSMLHNRDHCVDDWTECFEKSPWPLWGSGINHRLRFSSPRCLSDSEWQHNLIVVTHNCHVCVLDWGSSHS